MADIDLELGADDLRALDEMRKEAPSPEPVTSEQPENAAPEPEVVAEQAISTDVKPTEQPRDDKGKFAKPPEQEQPDRRVPLAELIEERKARQELQRKLDEMAQAQARLDERQKMLQERITKPAEPAKPVNVDENPIEALKQTRQQVEQLNQFQQQAFQRQQFATHVATQVQDYKTQTPDYDSAYRYLREGRVAELSAMGLPQSQIAAQLEQDEFGISALALQRGENPGAALYKIAQARGYKKPEPQAQPVQQTQLPTAQQKLETIAKGQQAARSLGSAGGAADTALTLERLVEMTPEQLANLPEDQFRKIMGAR